LNLSTLDYLAAAAAAAAAGAVNALAGGGTLISFPTLVAIGVPPVNANVTNTVSLVPGYLTGSWAQRDDLKPQMGGARILVGVAAAGGLAGSIVLLAIPAQAFRLAVPYLIVLSCVLLLLQDRLRVYLAARGARVKGAGPASEPVDASAGGADGQPAAGVGERHGTSSPSAALVASVFAAAAYGGFFGAGLSIMLLAVLGMFSWEPLTKLNALKQALAFVVNLVAAVFFAFSDHVVWSLVLVMAAASMVGGLLGGRVVTVIDSGLLRKLVVVAGLAVAVSFWVA